MAFDKVPESSPIRLTPEGRLRPDSGEPVSLYLRHRWTSDVLQGSPRATHPRSAVKFHCPEIGGQTFYSLKCRRQKWSLSPKLKARSVLSNNLDRTLQKGSTPSTSPDNFRSLNPKICAPQNQSFQTQKMGLPAHRICTGNKAHGDRNKPRPKCNPLTSTSGHAPGRVIPKVLPSAFLAPLHPSVPV